jgi:hypothetical protein
MNGWAIFGMAVAAAAVATVVGFGVVSAPEIKRYIKIRRM